MICTDTDQYVNALSTIKKERKKQVINTTSILCICKVQSNFLVPGHKDSLIHLYYRYTQYCYRPFFLLFKPGMLSFFVGWNILKSTTNIF